MWENTDQNNSEYGNFLRSDKQDTINRISGGMSSLFEFFDSKNFYRFFKIFTAV